MKTILSSLCVALVLQFVLAGPSRAQDEPPPGEPQGQEPEAGEEPPVEDPPVEDPPPEEPPAEEAPAEPPAQDAGAVLPDAEFTREASKADFDKAKALYAQGKYKDAEAIFKKLKADGKTKDDKNLLERWARGAGGALVVEKVKAKVKARQYQQAMKEAEDYARLYAGTPAEAGFRALIQEAESQLFIVLESFNAPSAAYSEKYGKTYVKDANLWLDGTLCLRWASTKDRKNTTLKIKTPAVSSTEWSQVEAVEFWVYSISAPTDVQAVIGCGDPAASAKRKAKAKATGIKKKQGDEAAGHYIATVRFPGGSKKWSRVRIPMGDFQAQGEADWKGVLYFQIQVGEGRAFDFLIDKIALQKKAGANAAAKK